MMKKRYISRTLCVCTGQCVLKYQVSSIMVECARHVSLVKTPTDATDSETLIGRVLSECDYKQHALLKQLLSILEGDKLARLATASVSVRCEDGADIKTINFVLFRYLVNQLREGSIPIRLPQDLEKF